MKQLIKKGPVAMFAGLFSVIWLVVFSVLYMNGIIVHIFMAIFALVMISRYLSIS